MAAAAVYLHRQSPSFGSTASVQLSTSSQTTTSALAVNTSAVVVTSQPVAKLVTHGLSDVPGSSVSASFDSTTNIMFVSSRASTPQVAQSVANAYADAYILYLQEQARAESKILANQLVQAEAAVQKIANEVATAPASKKQLLDAQEQTALDTYSSVDAEISAAQLDTTPATLSQPAGYGGSTRSSKAKILILAALIGLIAGAGIAMVRAQLDTRLRDAMDVEDVVDVPLLAELPYDRSQRRNKLPLLILDQPQSSFAQSIRELRTTVQVLLEASACPVVVVTSPEPNDGKTFVAANLAASWALSGKRTILVSGDLRRPQIEVLLGIPHRTGGLATLIESSATPARRGRGTPGATKAEEAGAGENGSGETGAGEDSAAALGNGSNGGDPARPISWKLAASGPTKEGGPGPQDRPSRRLIIAALVGTELHDLALLPAGPTPNDAADLLAGRAMQVLVTRLKDLADVILIDSPPVLAVVDSTILGTYADGVVIVAKAKSTTKEVLEQAAKRLFAANVNVLGVALNRSANVKNRFYPQYYASPPTPVSTGTAPVLSPPRRGGRLRPAGRNRTKE